MKVDVVIIGAGPGGLQCGNVLAANGAKVLILERKKIIGKKVCAGGITWSGLIERIPQKLIERSFCSQVISTRFQNITIQSPHPIIATVNRQKLGTFMVEKAANSGAEVLFPVSIIEIKSDSVLFEKDSKQYEVSFDYLVGADGSSSNIRKTLGISRKHVGTGLNYTVPCSTDKMEWHFNAEQFGSGYSWIFPHRDSTSVGVYSSNNKIKPFELNKRLLEWGNTKKIKFQDIKPEAEKICYDYQGWNFGRTFLVGDAAGLASPLTGEGIFPAFISAEAVANTILDKTYFPAELKKIITKHHRHASMVQFASKRNSYAFVLSELSAFCLRYGLISFDKFEMA